MRPGSCRSVIGHDVLKIGHKGADAIEPGNTIASFLAAERAGVDAIEFDVIWTADGDPRTVPAARRSPLVIAHDWADAASRRPPAPALSDVLDALMQPPLDRLRFDLDLKLPGREEEVVAALRERDLIGRAMSSTMEVESIRRLAQIAPDLRRGWTLPRVSRDWRSTPWAKPFLGLGAAAVRRRLPGIVARQAGELGVQMIWAYHPLITARLVSTCHELELELIAWTADDPASITRLVELGVDGICTNDPRLLG